MKERQMKVHVFAAALALLTPGLVAQKIDVDVNLNVSHILGQDSTFKREKFINIHSDVTTNYWYDDDLFTDDLINEFLNAYDVYMGRNTGGITWISRTVKEDTNRPGFCDTLDLARLGQKNRDTYASNTLWHGYEARNNLNLCTQLWPLYPDGTVATSNGWYYSDADTEDIPWGTASGEFFAHFIKDFFGTGGTSGQPKPAFVEITNEPLWELSHEIDRAFKYHRTVAHEIRKLNPDMKISGYCTAFPNLEEDNFQRWENRWMKFMDEVGEDMDIWSIHLYDRSSIDGGARKQLRRGSNVEATMDMMEHYSMLKFGQAKPFIISEFGGGSHDYNGAWHPYLDYIQNVSCNALTMQFMERSNNIVQAMNYTMLKASWGTTDVNNVWSARLLRRENEPESLTGQWIYSDRVQYYQLWANVRGKRIDTRAHHLDILSDAFVDGNKAYVILNNLAEEDKELKMNLFESSGLNIEHLMVKYFHLDDTYPVYDDNVGIIDTIEYASGEIPDTFYLDYQGTMILEYTFDNSIPQSISSTEKKYYATEYYKAIQASTPLQFQVNNILVPGSGEAVLRLGMGREHGKTLRPQVLVNGTELVVPADFRGDNQEDREVYFGVIEIDVPLSILQLNNTIEVTFPEDGGHVSSVAMQVFAFSGQVERSGKGAVSGISVTPSTQWLPLGGWVQLSEEVYPTLTDNKKVTWHSSNEELATVSETGMVQAKNTAGTLKIYATTEEGGFTDSCLVSIEEIQPGSLTVDDKNKYKTTTYYTGGSIEVILDYFAGTNETVTKYRGGIHVLLRHLDKDWGVIQDWSFCDSSSIGTNSGRARVNIKLDGITPTSELQNGDFYFLFPGFLSSNGESYSVQGLSNINIVQTLPGSLSLDDANKYLSSTYYTGDSIEVILDYFAGTNATVTNNNGGVHVLLQHMDEGGNTIEDWSYCDSTSIGTNNGTAKVIVRLDDLTPTSELQNGEYYSIFPRFLSSNGESYSTEGLSGIQIENEPTHTKPLTLSGIRVYPNPAADKLHIESLSAEPYSLSIYNLQGSLMMNQLCADRKTLIDISELTAGSYIITVKGIKTDERLIIHKQ